ncbi:creatininase family protein [Candidatus Magnetominusculus dajiuhuensis]|uniref:creatininase family protein n=1 Tax=Candidatus Magnetominusculus dajiuhuensis TaxID=3137712 RepID=UPI003B439079
MILQDCTMAEFTEYLQKTKTIVFPFGTIEEHGSHLPLSTDTLTIEEAVHLAGKERDFFLAPPIHYGVCTSNGNHPGTIRITAKTLRHLTLDLVRDAYTKGLRNFLLISGHGGSLHMEAIKEVSEILIHELDDIRLAVFSPYEMLIKELFGLCETENDGHAGELETSMVLAISPNLVKGRAKEEYPQFPKPFIVRDKVKYWPGGVWGNPEKASIEKGKKAIKIISDKIIELIDRIEQGEEF